MRDEDDRRAARFPDVQQLDVQPFARHLVECTERLVHEEESRVERQRSRDRNALLHPAGELPGVVALEAAELDELEHLLDLGRAPFPVPAGQLERQGDVLGDGAPVVENGVLEDDAVVAVDPCLTSGLAVDERRSRGRLDQVADDPQERRFATARGADQGDELALFDLQFDRLQRCCGPNCLVTSLIWTTLIRRRAPVRGARRASLRSGQRGRRKSRVPRRSHSSPTGLSAGSCSTGCS